VIGGAVVTVLAAWLLAFVHIITVSAVTLEKEKDKEKKKEKETEKKQEEKEKEKDLKALVAVAGIVEDSIPTVRPGVARVTPGAEVKLWGGGDGGGQGQGEGRGEGQ
jgi:hypothetical protein